MMKFEIVASEARERVRAELDRLSVGTEVFSKRRDYYTIQNSSGFQFVFITGLLFKPLVAYFTPAIAICHRSLAKQFHELEESSFFKAGRPRERWEPPNFLHLYGLRGRKETMFGELAPLLKAATEEFHLFLSCADRFRAIADPESLLQFLNNELDGIYGPTGLLIEMFLDHLILSERRFTEKYFDQQLPPMHQEFYQAVLAHRNID